VLLLQRLICARVLLIVRTGAALDLGFGCGGRFLRRVGVTRRRSGEGVPAFVTELRQDTASVVGSSLNCDRHPVGLTQFDHTTADSSGDVNGICAHWCRVVSSDQVKRIIHDHESL